MIKKKVMLARFPGNFHEDPDTVTWMIRTLKEMYQDPRIGFENVHHFTKADTPIDMVRNESLEHAKRLGVDYVLMIDSDMKPDQPRAGAVPFWKTAFDWLYNHHAPAMIAAPYVGPKPYNNSYIFRWANYNNFEPHNFHLRQFTREESAERTGIEKVAALPTGLLLLDMRMLSRMKPPYFYYEWADPPFNTKKGSTEDVTFTRDAAKAWWDVPGAGCYVAWDSWAIHIKRTYCEAPELPHIDQLGWSLNEAKRINRRSDEKIMMIGGDSLDMRFPPRIPYTTSAHNIEDESGSLMGATEFIPKRPDVQAVDASQDYEPGPHGSRRKVWSEPVLNEHGTPVFTHVGWEPDDSARLVTVDVQNYSERVRAEFADILPASGPEVI